MVILYIILIGLYMLVFIPAFMFTWEGSVFDGIGCYGWFCMLVGFPGVVLALIIKGIIKLFELPSEIKAEKERRLRELNERIAQQKREEEEAIRQEEEAIRQRAYQKSLEEKRNKIYPNSPVTQEIVGIIIQNKELPYSIEVKSDGLTFRFENTTKAYVFRSHGLPDMNRDEEKIFADVLNQKLNNKYSISEITNYHSFTHSDGTPDGFAIHTGTRMTLKTTRTF